MFLILKTNFIDCELEKNLSKLSQMSFDQRKYFLNFKFELRK